METRTAIRNYFNHRYQVDYNEEEIIITNGRVKPSILL